MHTIYSKVGRYLLLFYCHQVSIPFARKDFFEVFIDHYEVKIKNSDGH